MTDSDPTLSSPIRVVGEVETRLTSEDLAALPSIERRVEIACASGDRYAAAWRGVPISALLERVGPPEDATHVVVEAADGYRVCVEISTALEGVFALFRDGRPLAETEDYETRFVAEGVDGPRTVKAVATIRSVAIEPGEDPEEREDLLLDDRDDGS